MTNQKLSLAAEKRTALGKKAKQLRKTGVVPGNISGLTKEALAVSVNLLDFLAAYKQVHETGVVYLEVEKESIPTLIAHVERHPLSNEIVHVDFRRVNLKQKIETQVPVVLIGEADAVKIHGGVLLTHHDHLTIEAYPQDIPAHIEIDIAALKEVGQEIKVSDLASSSTYVILDEPEMGIVTVTAHKEESITPETTAETPELVGASEGDAENAEEGASEEKSE